MLVVCSGFAGVLGYYKVKEELGAAENMRGSEGAVKIQVYKKKLAQRVDKCLHEKEGLVYLFTSSALFLSSPCVSLRTDVAYLPSRVISRVDDCFAFSWLSYPS